MTMKAVKEALEDLKRKAHDVGDDGSWNLALAANAEIAALEKAARAISEDARVYAKSGRTGSVRPSLDLLLRIAKEAE